MAYTRIENTFVIRLDKGEEIMEALRKFCYLLAIASGSFTAIGAVEKATISFFEPEKKKFSSKEFTGNYEIVSLTGNISQMRREPYLHCHVIISDNAFCVFGGHLKTAIVSTTCEIILMKLPVVVERKYNDDIGLNLLHFGTGSAL